MSVRSWQYFQVFVLFTASIDRVLYVPTTHRGLAARAAHTRTPTRARPAEAAVCEPSHVIMTRCSSERCIPATRAHSRSVRMTRWK